MPYVVNNKPNYLQATSWLALDGVKPKLENHHFGVLQKIVSCITEL